MPATLVKVATQEVIRHKTIEKDGYTAVVVGVEKKELDKPKGQKVSYRLVQEYRVAPEILESFTL